MVTLWSLVMANVAFEHGHLNMAMLNGETHCYSAISMASFHSYVKLPEGRR